MSFLSLRRVESIPTTLEPNTFYIEKGTGSTQANFHVVGTDPAQAKHLFTADEAQALVDAQIDSMQNISVVSSFSNTYGLPNGRNQIALALSNLDDNRNPINSLYEKSSSNKPYTLEAQAPVEVASNFRVVTVSKLGESGPLSDAGCIYFYPSVDGTKLKAKFISGELVEPLEFEKVIAGIGNAFASKKINIAAFQIKHDNKNYVMVYLTKPGSGGELMLTLFQFHYNSSSVTMIDGVTSWAFPTVMFSQTNYTHRVLQHITRNIGGALRVVGIMSIRTNDKRYVNINFIHRPDSVTTPVLMSETDRFAEYRQYATDDGTGNAGFIRPYIATSVLTDLLQVERRNYTDSEVPTITTLLSGYVVYEDEDMMVEDVAGSIIDNNTDVFAVKVSRGFPNTYYRENEVLILTYSSSLSQPLRYLTSITKQTDSDCIVFAGEIDFTTNSTTKHLQLLNYYDDHVKLVTYDAFTGWTRTPHYLTFNYYGGTPFDNLINTPSITYPSNGQSLVDPYILTITGSAFSTDGVLDTHLNSDWELATDSEFTNVLQSSYADTVQLTQFDPTNLDFDSQYYIRTRYRGESYGETQWSDVVGFSTFEMPIAKASITSPEQLSTEVATYLTITTSAFSVSNTTDTHEMSDWELATDGGFANIILSSYNDTTNKTSWALTGLEANTQYYVRVRHKGSVYGFGQWSDPNAFLTVQYPIVKPTITEPVNGSTNTDPYMVINASAFTLNGAVDTHVSTDWEIATDSEFTTIVQSSYNDTVNMTSFAPSLLATDKVYYLRARYTGLTYGDSQWSDTVSFTQNVEDFFTLMSNPIYNDPTIDLTAENLYVRVNRASVKPNREITE